MILGFLVSKSRITEVFKRDLLAKYEQVRCGIKKSIEWIQEIIIIIYCSLFKALHLRSYWRFYCYSLCYCKAILAKYPDYFVKGLEDINKNAKEEMKAKEQVRKNVLLIAWKCGTNMKWGKIIQHFPFETWLSTSSCTNNFYSPSFWGLFHFGNESHTDSSFIMNLGL